MNSRWPDDLRRRMGVHQEPPPEGLWNDIEQIIQKTNSIKPASKPKSKLLWDRRIAAIAAMAILVSVISYFIFDNEKEVMLAIKERAPESIAIETTKVNEDKPAKNDYPADAENSHLLKKANIKTLLRVNKVSLWDSAASVEKSVASIEGKTEVSTQEAPLEGGAEPAPKGDKEKNEYRGRARSKHIALKAKGGLLKKERNSKKEKWSANVYASNIASSIDKYDGYGSLLQDKVLFEGEEEAGPAKDATQEIVLKNVDREVHTDVKHKQPLVVGISANYLIDNRWSIRSGLIYAMLSSELRSGSKNYYYLSKQTLHNIGIPFSVNYNCWERGKLSVYFSAGGLVEKNVAGDLTTNYLVDKKNKSTKKENLSIDQLQWSLNISAGLQYSLSKNVGLYVEPGVSYYLKNKSEVNTIYKDKPLNISLRLGLNFTLKH